MSTYVRASLPGTRAHLLGVTALLLTSWTDAMSPSCEPRLKNRGTV